jgi:hypothetical protein
VTIWSVSAQLDVRRVGFAMPDGDDRDPIFRFQIDHVSTHRAAVSSPLRSRGDDSAQGEHG